MASEVRDSNGRDHDLQDDEVSPRSRSVEDKDCDKPKLNPEQALNLTDGDVDDLRKLLVDNNLPLDNPVLIVEVLANRQAVHSDEEEEADASAMKFTFNKEDLLEVFGQFGQVSKVELSDENECA